MHGLVYQLFLTGASAQKEETKKARKRSAMILNIPDAAAIVVLPKGERKWVSNT